MKLKLLSAIFYLAVIPFVNGAAAAGGTDDGDEATMDAFQELILTAQSEDVAYQREVKEFFDRRKERLLRRLESFSALRGRLERRLETIGNEDSSDQESVLAALLESEDLSPEEKVFQIALLERAKEGNQAIKAAAAARASEIIDALGKSITTIQEELRRLPV